MRLARAPQIALLVALSAAGGCAHRSSAGRVATPAGQRLATEAASIRAIAFEEDFLDARLVYQALPLDAPPRAALRLKLLQYLLGPVASLDPDRVRKDPSYLDLTDGFDRLHESFRDALELFAAPEIWDAQGPRVSAEERRLLAASARVIVTLYSPRGNELAVATALFTLAALEPANAEWSERLGQLLSWVETGAQLAIANMAPRGAATGANPGEVLEGVASVWPSPLVIDHLARATLARQERLASVLRRPIGTGTRGGIGELLLDTEALQATAVGLAALYLRGGQLAGAAEALKKIENRPGDDPDARELVRAASRSDAKPDAFLRLARRFLPRIELLGGTSNDRLDIVAAAEALRLGIERHPRHPDLLLLASRVARLRPAPFLALRYLEEAQAAMEASGASAEAQAELAAEHMELAFSRLRVRIDPERIEPAAREADLLRQQIAAARRRFGGDRVRVSDADIDFEIARGFVDAGLIARAEPLLLRAHQGEPNVEVTLQIANLVLKRGDGARAARLLREAFDKRMQSAGREETIGFVEGQSKLARALGNAYEATGDLDEAQRAWRLSLRGWERLMVVMLQRKNLAASAEATFEVGRLTYLLGERADGVQKFNEAIEQNEARDQTYIDAISFLVQQGDAQPALDIYRRMLGRGGGAVSEYVKVYASLWILDITRRSTRTPEFAAETFLRALESRKVHLRPSRSSAWYIPLARYALGRLSYDELAAMANTPGKRAELYFYEAMRRLADGKSDDAHSLWGKVLETQMFSFFEFEMASRYLRTGAPTAPRDLEASESI